MKRFEWCVAGLLLLGLRTVSAVEPAPLQASPEGRQLPGSYSVTTVGAVPVTAAQGHALMYTEQYLAFDGDVEKLAEADIVKQTTELVKELDLELQRFRCNANMCMRMHVCLKHGSDRVAVEQVLYDLLKGRLPALTFVESDLPVEEALVGIDAVAYSGYLEEAYRRRLVPLVSRRKGIHGSRHAFLPPGQSAFVSGQAVRGESMADSARLTMEQLGETLKFLGADWTNVVHLKTFLREPVKNVPTVREVIVSHFPDSERIPPQVYVEWTAKGDLEIELVVDVGPAAEGRPRVEYLTPPGLKASPVFCRVVRVNHGKIVYTSGITGPTGPADQQVRSIFDGIHNTMAVFRVDMRHLVKATYYVSDESAGASLNRLRPKIFDPERPPAASKATVRGLGLPGATIAVDMIGVAEE